MYLSSSTEKRIFASGVIGNLLEMYDVTICVFMSQILASTFFPTENKATNLFNVFILFFISYLSRPLGSVILGLFADYTGRKRILILTIFLLGFSTAAIGFIPSCQKIGIVAVLLFFFMRILQSFVAAGEYISSLVYVIESANEKKRNFYGSWPAVGINSGTLLASLVCFLLTYLMSNHILPAWSWRLAFIFSLVGMGFGLWVRYSIPESMDFILQSAAGKKLDNSLIKSCLRFIRHHPIQSFGVCLLTWLGVSVTFAFFIYAPIHMTTINHLTQQEAFKVNTFALMLLVALIPVFGILSERVNRLSLILIVALGFAMIAFPYFNYFTYGGYNQVLIFQLLASIPSACFFGLVPTFIAETFPIEVRCTAFALLYQTTASFAAGLTPLILFYLSNGAHASPAWLIVLPGITGCVYLFYSRRKNLLSATLVRNSSVISHI